MCDSIVSDHLQMVMAVITTLFIICWGAIFQFNLFLRNSFGLLFLTFWLFNLAMSSVAFLLSTFLSKSGTAVTFGFVMFITGWVMQVSSQHAATLE